MLRFLEKFRKDQEGSATVEAVLWLPFFVIIFVMIADVSFVFHRQSQALRVVQDANRAFSVGRLNSTIETEDFVLAGIAAYTTGASVSTTVTSGIIRTTTLIPVDDMTAVNFFRFLRGYNVEVTSEHYLEY